MLQSVFYGLLDLSFWGYVIAALALTHITIAGVTIYLHRLSAHRAIEVNSVISHFFRFWLWLTTGMVTKEWTAIHRKHHAKCETEEDPHSPQVFGIAKVMWEGAELYRRESRNPETLARYGAGTPDDWIERNLYTKYSREGVKLMLIIDILLFGVPGVVIWALQMAWIPFFAAGVVNGIGHFWGYRNFECGDAAMNVVPWGILIGGEELHNNHHTYPTSAKFSVKWWEVDIGWMYIRTLSFFKLAKVKRTIPEPMLLAGKKDVDEHTLAALLSNRLDVMARYAKAVLLPVLRQQQQLVSQKEAGLLKRIRTALIREPSLVDKETRSQMMAVVAEHPPLDLVVTFKQRLQEIWDHTTASQKELLEALEKWCKDAEATGVHALRDFAQYIQSYSLKQQLA